MFRKIRKIFDPHNIYAPARQVFSEEEFKNLPPQMFDAINGLRVKYGMPEREQESEQ
jgi:hypothetical protein